MIRVCPQCQITMEMNNQLYSPYGVQIIKKRKGLFNNTRSNVKVAVCTSCGYVTMYVENYEEYKG